ncbi:MAG: PASTA domain-containing protein [Muribaculaceae bacterium]|nr:PASTA domain-containing protein [Muribaculaceae bacterium]
MKSPAPEQKSGFSLKHPIIVNLAIIILVAILGICIVYLSIAIFTKHGQSDKVPGVENMRYTQAIQILHESGLKVDIRDSLYKDDVKPGYVIEQFPKAGATVKPGRKIFLYINSVHPKETVIDDDNHPLEDALHGFSYRSALAKLQELGFKDIQVVRILGDNECVAKLTANGVTIKKMQKVPVNAKIVMQVYDGRLAAITDSLMDEEMLSNYRSGAYDYDADYDNDGAGDYSTPQTRQTETASEPSDPSPSRQEEEEDLEFF